MHSNAAIPTPVVTALTRAVSNDKKHQDRAASLPRRFLASSRLAVECVQVWAYELDAVCREGVADLRQASRDGEKVFDAAVEGERVRAAQLTAHARYLENISYVYEEDVGTAVQCALALLAAPDPLATRLPLWAVRVDVEAANAVSAIDQGARVRDGVDPSGCVVSGDGLTEFVCGEGGNVVCVRTVDACADVMESVEEEDVSVCVGGAEGEGAIVRMVEEGVFQCVYVVAAGRKEQLTLSVSVCGTVLAGSPWTVQRSLDSVILPQVPSAIRLAFLRELTSVWLPGMRSEILYRGSRDGLTPIAFHRLCDGKGPTLTLIRSDNGYTFGGYSSVSWFTPDDLLFIPCPDAFVFCVEGPYGSVTKFPVQDGRGIGCFKLYGPIFDGGVGIGSRNKRGAFDSVSVCLIGSGYDDVLGQGHKTLTGAHSFVPAEVEVYAVEVPPQKPV